MIQMAIPVIKVFQKYWSSDNKLSHYSLNCYLEVPHQISYMVLYSTQFNELLEAPVLYTLSEKLYGLLKHSGSTEQLEARRG